MKLQESQIEFKPCDISHLDDICALQELAFAHLDNPDLLRRNSEEMLQSCLSDPHYTLGAFYEGSLIAFAMLYDAGESAENIGHDLGLAGAELQRVINMKLIIVSPDYRGNGLQKKLMTALENLAKEKGKEFICGTVSPDNSYSCRNFIALGYEQKGTKIKYGGLKRNVYCKTL